MPFLRFLITMLAVSPLLFSVLIRPAVAETGLDGFNDWAYSANQAFASQVVKPALEGVRALPDPLPTTLSNVYSNLIEPVSGLSHAMSGDLGAAGRSTLRFVINSTVGMLGIVDVADFLSLPAEKRTFSEGVCALGIPAGPYLIVPGVGSSSLGVTSAAVLVMAGSTWALALVSLELALASTALDFMGSAAALEGAAVSAESTGDYRTDEIAYRHYLAKIGC